MFTIGVKITSCNSRHTRFSLFTSDRLYGTDTIQRGLSGSDICIGSEVLPDILSRIMPEFVSCNGIVIPDNLGVWLDLNRYTWDEEVGGWQKPS